MINSTAILVALLIVFGATVSLFILVLRLKQHILTLQDMMTDLTDGLGETVEALKLLDKSTEQHSDMLNHTIQRQEYSIILAKYSLASARLYFIGHKLACIEHDDYENAAQLNTTIQKIEELLSSE